MARRGAHIYAEGLDKLIKKLGTLSPRITARVDAEFGAAATEMEEKAVDDVPVNEGVLRNSIGSARLKVMDWEVSASAAHAPYMEWGTKSKVNVPPGLQAYAAQFRGKGGSSKDAQKAIYEWCRLKGIEESQWWFIFISVMVHGISPKPFFFKNFYPLIPKVTVALSRIVAEELKKN